MLNKKHFTQSNESLINLKGKIEDLKLLKNDSHNYIYEYLLKLRNVFDIDREEARELIDTHYLRLIEEVENIEAECKMNSLNLKGDYGLEAIEASFDKIRAELDKLEINKANCDKIVFNSHLQVNNLGAMKKSLENEPLLNKAYEFFPIIDSLKNEIKSAKIYTKIVNY